MSKVLVTGGAGYIGSHMVHKLLDLGESVVVIDDFSTGFKDSVPRGVEIFEGDYGSASDLNKVFVNNKIDSVIHFASMSQVGESVGQPSTYYRKNVVNTINLLDCLVTYKINKFIFSSSAAVYGDVEEYPITENCLTKPINPYGKTKLFIEEILTDYDHAYGFKSVSLRYFNAAGADNWALNGERHIPETHLIPLILQVANGRRTSIDIFGTDYPTLDGTCIRDYVHVDDLCKAHYLALKHLRSGGQSKTYNLGNGLGFSVKEVISATEEVTGKSINVTEKSRRHGDPAVLVADSTLIQNELGWSLHYTDIKDIIRTAWNWELQKGKTW